MQFQHVDRDQKGEFFLNNADGQRIAEISYIWRDETTIDANHTWVDDSLRGQGVARLLLDTLVDFSREKNLKIRFYLLPYSVQFLLYCMLKIV